MKTNSAFWLVINEYRDERRRTWVKVSEKSYKSSAAANAASRKLKLQPLQFIQITEIGSN